MPIYRGDGGSAETSNNATANQIAQDAVDAAASATAAAASASAAAASETAAETAETNAETAETNAETAETNALTSETNAAASAAAAAASETATINFNTNLVVTASGLSEGASPTVSYNDTTYTMSFGIPVGATGATGSTGATGATGPAGADGADGIQLTALSVTTNAVGTAALSYNNTTGVFSYTPPDLSGYLTSYTETDTLDSVTGRGATTTNAVTVGSFTSTGIDDNATSTQFTIGVDDAQFFNPVLPLSVGLTVGGNTSIRGDLDCDAFTATNAVLEGTTDPILTLRSTDDGPLYMEFERGTDRHAYVGFDSGDTFKIWNEESAGLIQLGTNNTEAVRIDESQNVDISGNLTAGDGTNISMSGTSTGQIKIDGDGYDGAIALDATGMHIYHNSASRSLLFGTNETERMRISGTGTVGIGTSSPAQTLDVVGNIQSTGSNSRIIAGTAGQGQVALTLNDGGGNANLTFNHAGNAPDISGNNAARIAVNTDSSTAGSMLFEVGTAVTGAITANFGMYATGDFHADGNVIAYSTSVSDERLKDDIQPITGALDAVDALRGVTFTWNDGSRQGKRDYGLIAQEVEKVIPEVVHETGLPLMKGEDDKTLYKTIDYDKLVSVLVEAVSELRAEVEALKNGTSV